MKIVVLDAGTLGDDISLAPIGQTGELCVYHTTDPEQVASRLSDATVAVVNKIRLNASNLADATGLKLICVAATGYDNIDTEYCKEKQIAVCNVPGYSTDSVAQVTAAMALSLVTHLPEYSTFVSSGEYSSSGVANRLVPVYRELSSMTWGVVGGGGIGSAVASIAEAFGCKVLMCRRKPDSRYEQVDIDELCRRSDIISLHVPLTEQTKGMINRTRIERMKRGVVLINVARGAVADEEALARGVEEGQIGALGIDVYSREPFSQTHPFTRLLGRDNVCFTPHMAWGSAESRARCVSEIAENIRTFFSGGLRNRIV